MLFKLILARRAVYQRMKSFYRKRGRTELEWFVLRLLRNLHRPCHNDLVRVTGLSKPTLTRILRKLEEEALVTRGHARKPGHKRFPQNYKFKYSIELTAYGREVVRDGWSGAQDRYLDAEEKFGADDLVQLYDLFDRFIVALYPESVPVDLTDARRAEAVARLRAHKRDAQGRLLPLGGVTKRPKTPKPKTLTKRKLDRLAGVQYSDGSEFKGFKNRMRQKTAKPSGSLPQPD